MAIEQVLSDRDSEDEVDDDVADFEDRRVCLMISYLNSLSLVICNAMYVYILGLTIRLIMYCASHCLFVSTIFDRILA